MTSEDAIVPCARYGNSTIRGSPYGEGHTLRLADDLVPLTVPLSGRPANVKTRPDIADERMGNLLALKEQLRLRIRG